LDRFSICDAAADLDVAAPIEDIFVNPGRLKQILPLRRPLLCVENAGNNAYASAPGSFMMPNDFTNDNGKKLFGKLRIKLSSRSKVTETGDLLRLSVGVRRRQVVLGLQNSNLLSTPEALRQHVNDGGVYIVDTGPYVLKLGHGGGQTDISQSMIRLFDR
jgi:hypothetical protein